MEDERHKMALRTLRIVAGVLAPAAIIAQLFLGDFIVWLLHARFGATTATVPGFGFPPGGLVGVAGLLACAVGFYAEHDPAQAYRAIAAAIFTGMASASFTTDPGLNVQNVLIGLAAVISIASILAPPLHRKAADMRKPHHHSA